jgi:ATP-dependent Clp protease ATP-binding subunit ClpA
MFAAYVYVRVAADGRVVAIPLDFPDLVVEDTDVDSALRGLRPLIARALRQHGAGLAADGVPDLDRVVVSVARGKAAKPLELTVGLVVLRRRSSRSDVFVVRAPAVPGFEIVVSSREEAAASTAVPLAKHLRDWPLDALLAMDELEEAQLEVIELALPPVARSAVADDFEDREEGDIFAQAGESLTARALEGRLQRFDRRDELVDRVIAALSAPDRSSVLLVGPADVGKTALVHELAARIASGEVPPALIGRDVWRLSANELIAGARYTGMWQDRVRRLVTRALQDASIVVMGDPVGIVDAGRWSESSNNMSRYLRPYLESGELTAICEASRESLAAAQRREPSFVEAFQVIEVPEPSTGHSLEIARAQAARLEVAFGVAVGDDASEAAVSLTRRFEPYRALPGKAVRLLDESTQRALRLHQDHVGRAEVVEAFAERTGMPLALLSDEIPMSADAVRSFFEARVLGQAEAVEAMVDLTTVLKASLNDPSKPSGVFFFVGPTGVGKTELAKALAAFLFGDRERVIRFDMGEFAAADAITRFVGTRWSGDDEGELTRRVREQPFSVVLLDEVEKAHWRVFDLLLAVMGEGRLTDASGRTADFRNTIVIMTSNLGASARQTRAVGFDSGTREEAARLRMHYVEEAERFFRPEFFNRIDRLIVFEPLGQETIRRIARREAGKLLLREGVLRRQLLVEIDDRAVDALAERGFHPQYGARPLQREIERAIIHPLARLIVDKQPQPQDVARIHLRDGNVVVDLQRIHAAEPTPRPRRDRREEQRTASIKKAVALVDELLERIDEQNAAPATVAVRAQTDELIGRTHLPAFWDDAESARQTLSRIYRLERVLDGFEALVRRAAGLRELAVQVQRRHDRSRAQELRDAIDEIDEQLAIRRLELEGASHTDESSTACIRVLPIGTNDRTWADTLRTMYAAWAERTGRDLQATSEDGQLLLSGAAAYELLRFESGIHRRVLGESDDLARVIVERDGAVREEEVDPGIVVRIYDQARRQGVRDPRTGVRVGNVTSVLEDGRIDEFLIACLRLETG